MNERIKELVEQARKYASEYVEDEVEMQFHKKFAELIVRECMELGDTALQKGNWPGDAIKKHFEIKD